MPRMDNREYAKAVADEIEKGKSGKFWYGEYAEMVRQSATAVAVPLEALVSACPMESSVCFIRGI